MIRYSYHSGRLLFSVVIMTHLFANSFTSWHKVFQKPGFTTDIMNEISNLPAYSVRGESLIMSTRQANVPNNVQMRKKQTQPLVTSLDRSRIMIGGQRWILPGDYVVHEEYGIGRCIVQASISICAYIHSVLLLADLCCRVTLLMS